MPADRIDAVVSLAKRRGFVFPSSEIYGGTRSAWDYGPLGVELKENVRRQWWKIDGPAARRHRRPGLRGHPRPRRVGGLRPPRRVRRPADRVPVVPQAVPGRPPRGGVRGQARHAAGLAAGAELPQLRQQGHLHRAADVQRPDEDLPRPGRERRGPALPAARRPRRASSSTTTTWRPPRARSRRSASRRSARASATRSRRATSSSGRASSSRWRWSSSSSPAPTSSGTSTGCRSAGTGTSTSASAGEPALLRAPEGEAVALLEAHGRHRVPLPVRRHRVLRARGHRQPHRLRPDHALQALRRRPVLLRPGEAASAGCRTSSSRPPA